MGQSAKEVSLAAQGLGQLAGLRIICINSGEKNKLAVKFGMSARLGLMR